MAYLSALMQSTSNNQSGTPNSFLFSLQEPWAPRNRIAGLGSRAHLEYDRTATRPPRAAIYASKDLDIWYMPEWSTPDQATCMWKTGNPIIPTIIVTSVYFDITAQSTVSATLARLSEHCMCNSKPLLLCCDTNAHSTLWHSPQSNKRGEDVEEFILSNGLEVFNNSAIPTFQTQRGGTIIDVTMGSPRLVEFVQNWEVDLDYVGSDHHLIRFSFTISSQTQRKRDFRQGDWYLFQKLIAEADYAPPPRWTTDEIDYALDRLYRDIDRALDRSVKKVRVRNGPRPPTWWNEALSEAKAKVKRLTSCHRKTRTEASYQRLTEGRRAYSHLLRKTKRSEWQKFCNETTDHTKMARLVKIIKNAEQQTLGILKRNDGTMSSDPQETLEILLQSHFPQCGNVAYDDPSNPNRQVHHGQLNDSRVDFISVESIRQTIQSVGPDKAPGPDGIPARVLRHLGPSGLMRLQNIYRASVLLHYVPKRWREAKVIFLPKPGKDDYTAARSFRPITLSPVLFKVLEKVMLTYFKGTVLALRPLSANQHAFRNNYSTDTALSTAVHQIESAVYQKEYA